MNRRRIVIAASTLAVLAAVWIVFAFVQSRAARAYSGTVETREILIGSKIGGRVLAVPVEEGQRVPAGSLLVRFECDELQAQRAQAAAQATEAQADLDRMLHGNRPEEIQQAVATAHAEAAALEEARNGPRTEELHQAQADYAAARADSVNAETYFQRMEKLIAG